MRCLLPNLTNILEYAFLLHLKISQHLLSHQLRVRKYDYILGVLNYQDLDYIQDNFIFCLVILQRALKMNSES